MDDIIIPDSLKHPEFRFILLGKWDQFKKEIEGSKLKETKDMPGKKSKKELEELKDQGYVAQGKVPIEAAWQSSNHYAFDNPKLAAHISNGGNYGIATGFGNLAILDDDTADKQLSKLFEGEFEETFEVKTGSGGIHKYIIVPGMTKKIIFYNKDGHHLGELQWKTQQCVGPNAIHPTGEQYKVHKDVPIKEIPIEKIVETFKEFIPVKEKVIREHNIIEWNRERIQNIPITNIISTVGLHDMGNGNLQGPHPSHGSTQGMNFRVNTNSNNWYCWRCRSGGGPAELIGVMEGIIPCSRAGPRCFTVEEGKQIIQKAREKYGLKTPEKDNIFDIIKFKKIENKASQVFENITSPLADSDEEMNSNAEGDIPGPKMSTHVLSEEELEEVKEIREDVLQEIVEVFRDPDGVPYATISINGHHENLRIQSSAFKNFVIKVVYDKSQKPPTKTQLENIIAIFTTQALFDAACIEVYLRAAHIEDKIYIDIGDKDWKVLMISPKEIKVLESKLSPVKFKRFRHMKELVFDLGARMSDIKLLWNFIPIVAEDVDIMESHVALLLIPDIPYAILVVHGDQGSGKSFSLKLMRQLIDPSSLKLLSMAKDKTELYQQLAHHYLPIFDNVTSITKEYSDLFCKVVTGEGFSKRQLYTDDEDVIYNYIRKLGFNGINLAGEEPDFLDRSVTVHLSRISRTSRRTESEILELFEKDRPKITGAMFKIIQKTLPLVKMMRNEMKILPRMADYTIWCEAAAVAMGKEKGIFTQAYFNKIEMLNKEAIEAQPLAVSLMEFMGDKNEWEGTASELLSKLEEIAGTLKISTKVNWPAAPSALGKKLREIQANLDDEGIKIHDINRKNKKRGIYITKSTPVTYKDELIKEELRVFESMNIIKG